MNLKTTFFIALSLQLLLTGCSDSSNNKEKISIPSTADAKKNIELKTIADGSIQVTKIDKGFSFSNAKNKAVLLSFFTSWCPPCKAELPHLNNLAKRYKNKLEIIGVLLEKKEKQEIEKLIKDYQINFTVTYGLNNYDMAKAIGEVGAIPFMILYDKKGHYATHYIGAIPEEMIDADIKKVLK